jgi:hypothetical protein
MKIENLFFASVAVVAFAGPAFAAGPTLSTTSTTTQSSVTSTIQPACALTGSLTTFLVTVDPNGGVTAPAAQPLVVTCNTPDGNITIGSDDMVNTAAPTIVETGTFTNVIKFIGQADGLTGGDAWTVDTRAATGFASAATVGYNTTRRVRNLSVSVEGAAPAGGLLPVAGSYSGTICVTVDPAGLLTGTGLQNNDTTCTVVAPTPL